MKEKVKRLTKKDQEQALIAWVQEFKEKALQEYKGYHNVHSQSFVHNNTNMLRCYCTACGHEWDMPAASGSTRHSGRIYCPNCSQKSEGNNSPVLTHMEEHDNGWYIVRYQFEQEVVDNHPEDIFAWMKNTPNYKISVYSSIRYEKGNDIVMYVDSDENGYRWYNSSVKKAYRRGSNDFNAIVERKYKDKCSSEPAMRPVYNALEEALKEIENTKAEAKAKRAPSKLEVAVEMQLRYKPDEKGIDKVKEAFTGFPLAIVSQYGKNSKYVIMCSHCGHMEYINATNPHDVMREFAGENRVCPHCGKTSIDMNLYAHHRNSPANARVFLYESTNLPDEELLLRIFEAKAEIELVPAANGTVTPEMKLNVHESTRFFFGTKISMYSFANGKWEKERSELRDYTTRSYYHSSTEICANANDELVEIIKNSRLRYSGFKEAIGTDKRYRCITAPTNLAYVATWYQNPAIEHVYKSQLYSLTNEIIAGRTRSDFKLQKGDNIYDALECTPMELKIARKCDLGSYDFDNLRKYCAVDPSVTPDGYKALTDKVHMGNAVDIAGFGIRWKEIIEYVDTVLLHQCISPNETMSVWADYLRMARDIGYNLRERSRRFPSSLRKEHDIASFAHRSLKREIDAKKFAENAEKNAERYEYSLDNLFAMVPTTVEQVVEEATNQHNCLASYVNRLISGDTCVVFIRYKDTPDSSYVTCEIRNDAFEQIKGFGNSNPHTSELANFIDKWCKAKKLKVNHW